MTKNKTKNKQRMKRKIIKLKLMSLKAFLICLKKRRSLNMGVNPKLTKIRLLIALICKIITLRE